MAPRDQTRRFPHGRARIDRRPGAIADQDRARLDRQISEHRRCFGKGPGEERARRRAVRRWPRWLAELSQTQAASDGARGIQLVYYAFDLLHLDGQTPAACRSSNKALLEPLITGAPGLQFNAHDTGDGEVVESMPANLVSRASCQAIRPPVPPKPRPMAQVQMPQPAGIRCRGLDGLKVAASSRRASARLLH